MSVFVIWEPTELKFAQSLFLTVCFHETETFQLLRVEIEETGHGKNRPQLTASTQPSNADPHQIFR